MECQRRLMKFNWKQLRTWWIVDETCKLQVENGLRTQTWAEGQKPSTVSRAMWRKRPLRSYFSAPSKNDSNSSSRALTWNAPYCPCWVTCLARTLSNAVRLRKQAWNKHSEERKIQETTSQKCNESSRRLTTFLAWLESSKYLELTAAHRILRELTNALAVHDTQAREKLWLTRARWALKKATRKLYLKHLMASTSEFSANGM